MPKKLKGATLNLARKTFRSDVDGGDPLWNESREFSRWEAWVYLFQRASYAPRAFAGKHAVVNITRGETPPLAERYLATMWGWSRKRARTLLVFLEKDGRIRPAQRTADGTTYVIVNYDDWQYGGPAGDTAEGAGEGTAGGTTDGTAKGTKKEVTKREKKESRRWRFVPEDWEPTEKHRELASERGVDFDAELAKFRDHEFDKPKTDPDRTFSNWLRNARPSNVIPFPKQQEDEWDIFVRKTQAELR